MIFKYAFILVYSMYSVYSVITSEREVIKFSWNTRIMMKSAVVDKIPE